MAMPEAMPEAKLAEIKDRNLRHVQLYAAIGLSEAEADRCDLLTEVGRLRAELANARNTVLNEALGEVVGRQMSDANRFAGEGRTSGGSCGFFCGHGETCHGAEAYAALNRLGSDLIALKNRNGLPAGGS